MSIKNEITRLQNAKASIKTAIENKGVTVSDDVKLDGYAALIDNISVGSGDGEEHVKPDFYSLRTNNGTNYGYLFYNYKGKNLDVSNWDTSKVTNMNYMFGYCSSLTSLNLSNWDISKVTDMNSVFYSCKSLTSLDLSSFNTSNVTNMNNMFRDCTSLTSLDLSNFNTSNVISMSYMFSGCNKLTSLDLSKFNTSKAIGIDYMLFNVPSNCTIYINPDTFIYKSTGKTFTPAQLNWSGTAFTPKYN